MDNLDQTLDALFAGTNAVGTSEVQREFALTYPETLEWAEELGVARVGASFAWTRDDVEALADELDALNDEEDAAEDTDDDSTDDEEQVAGEE